jgi:diketogulonate reductase-like aldo/keto reductase
MMFYCSIVCKLLCRVPYSIEASVEDQVRESLNVSLSNLGTEYLDSLVMHSPMRTFDLTMRVWRVFESFVAEGKVRSLGMSNTYDLRILQRLYELATVKPSYLQNRFYAKSGYDTEIREFCKENGIKYESFWTLTANPHVIEGKLVRDIASKYGATPQQIFFKFVRSLGIIPLSGTTSERHMIEDVAVESMPSLSEDEVKSLERALFSH